MKTTQNEELLRYYQSELTYLRRMGGEFAALYPRVASRLELGSDECPDPQVERLIESFAFLTARLQRDLDGEFPEITTALLGVLYPQFTAPVPPMAVARFDVDPDQGKLTTGFPVARHTALTAFTRQGHPCRFRTCYPVTLWPLRVAYAGFEDTGQFDFLDASTNVAAVLRLKLHCEGGGDLSELEGLRRLRFYLRGEPRLTSALYELLFCNVLGVAALPTDAGAPVHLPAGSILPVGFGPEEDVLPYPRAAHPGYRLLQEYFTFPEKYHFFDLANLDACRRGATLDLIFLLDRQPSELHGVGPGTFALGCTPIINLFRKTTEPIRLDHRTAEYRLVADKRRERTTEIHSILSVSASSNADDETRRFEPFYSYTHGMDGGEHKAFWHARRAESLNPEVAGTEMFLSFLDLDFEPSMPPAQTVYAHTLCTNRELATQLPDGAALQIEEQAPLFGISCLTRPTYPVQPPLRGQTLWRLVSHLSLNHLSLAEGRESLPALREILKLYSFSNRPSTEQQIAGLVSMECRPVARRVGRDAWRGFCRGTEVTLEFDEEMYVGSGAFLLAAVLERFFALYASINSFTQLRVRSRQREGVWKQWPPTVGEKIVL
ncbi:MAG TPA: type VI secretion system baseplate subunit TssF [Pyrinomonadaceae bacterium]|nr:type VI secretion system baseplate subunit TssF [Pyrinomonadaceae bacterium]